jgi:hypothetical protein
MKFVTIFSRKVHREYVTNVTDCAHPASAG